MRSFRQATVQLNYHVYLSEDKHFYSVPWAYRRKRVQVVYDERSVEISHNHQRIASHQRDRTLNGYTTRHEHMPPHHRFVAEWSPQALPHLGGEDRSGHRAAHCRRFEQP